MEESKNGISRVEMFRTTHRGIDAFIVDGFFYFRVRPDDPGPKSFKCASHETGCSVVLRTDGLQGKVTAVMFGQHNHESDLSMARRNLLCSEAFKRLSVHPATDFEELVSSVMEECTRKNATLLQDITLEDVADFRRKVKDYLQRQRKYGKRKTTPGEEDSPKKRLMGKVPRSTETLDGKLLEWYENAVACGTIPNDNRIKKKAKEIYHELTGVNHIDFRRNWILNWKRRKGISVDPMSEYMPAEEDDSSDEDIRFQTKEPDAEKTLSRLLYQWYENALKEGTEPSYTLIRLKAQEIHMDLTGETDLWVSGHWITNWKKKRGELSRQPRGNKALDEQYPPKEKKRLLPKDPRSTETLDGRLFLWYERALEEGSAPSNPDIREKAREIYQELTGDKELELSKTWIAKWKKRQGISVKQLFEKDEALCRQLYMWYQGALEQGTVPNNTLIQQKAKEIYRELTGTKSLHIGCSWVARWKKSYVTPDMQLPGKKALGTSSKEGSGPSSNREVKTVDPTVVISEDSNDSHESEDSHMFEYVDPDDYEDSESQLYISVDDDDVVSRTSAEPGVDPLQSTPSPRPPTIRLKKPEELLKPVAISSEGSASSAASPRPAIKRLPSLVIMDTEVVISDDDERGPENDEKPCLDDANDFRSVDNKENGPENDEKPCLDEVDVSKTVVSKENGPENDKKPCLDETNDPKTIVGEENDHKPCLDEANDSKTLVIEEDVRETDEKPSEDDTKTFQSIEDKREDQETQTDCDEDQAFLDSILPNMKKLTSSDKSMFKAQILQLLKWRIKE